MDPGPGRCRKQDVNRDVRVRRREQHAIALDALDGDGVAWKRRRGPLMQRSRTRRSEGALASHRQRRCSTHSTRAIRT